MRVSSIVNWINLCFKHYALCIKLCFVHCALCIGLLGWGEGLPLVVPPDSLRAPAERASFLAAHYWDAMDWTDSLRLESDAFMGESMATFATVVALARPEDGPAIVSKVVAQAAPYPRGLAALVDYAYSYLYHPDSPQYNPETYLLFADAFLATPTLDATEGMRIDEYRSQILKNRVGTTAADFAYVGTDGATHTLHATAPDAAYRLLFFYDPDCSTCDRAVDTLRADARLTDAVARGTVAVIAINAYGQPDGGPAIAKPSFPAEWIVGYSPEGAVDAEEVYVIRATPAIYLLDAGAKVLKKDISL